MKTMRLFVTTAGGIKMNDEKSVKCSNCGKPLADCDKSCYYREDKMIDEKECEECLKCSKCGAEFSRGKVRFDAQYNSCCPLCGEIL